MDAEDATESWVGRKTYKLMGWADDVVCYRMSYNLQVATMRALKWDVAGAVAPAVDGIWEAIDAALSQNETFKNANLDFLKILR